jgi:hypothetical protein
MARRKPITDQQVVERFAALHHVMVKQKLRPFQRALYRAVIRNRMTAFLGARQIGKTYCLAWCAIVLANGIVTADAEIPAHDVLVISISKDKSQAIIREIQGLIDTITEIVDEALDEGSSVTRILLANGQQIACVSGRPKSLQGATGSVLVDELSATDHDPEEILAQALSVTSAKDYYRLLCCSNAAGEESVVYSMFRSEDDKHRWVDWELQEATIEDVYPEGLPPHIAMIRGTLTPSQWAKWYLNQFVGTGEPFFDDQQLSSAIAGRTRCGASGSVRHVVGWDVGWTNNPSGVVVIECSTVIRVVECHRWYAVDEDEQVSRVLSIAEKYPNSTVVVDKGFAHGILRSLSSVLGSRRVVGVAVNDPSVSSWAESLGALMQDRTLDLSLGSSTLVRDLRNVRWAKRGNKLELPRMKSLAKGPGGKTYTDHCDEAVGLFLAISSAERGISETVEFAQIGVNMGNTHGSAITF